jgi:transcriptional regulator with PAS, ATPase and Fis domain
LKQNQVNSSRWQETFDAIEDIVFIIDREQNIVIANKAADNILGGGEKIVGKKCHKIVHNTSSPLSGCTFCQVFKSGETARFEIQEPNLNNHWYTITGFPIWDANHNIKEVIHIMRDSTREKSLLNVLDINKTNTLPKLKNPAAFSHIISKDLAVCKVMKEAELHAMSNIPVLITGESGTGKDLLAKAIHAASPRSEHTYTPVNMASVSSTLFNSEFFGHTKGAFTGSTHDRNGYLAQTDKGTLFMDEIGSIPLEFQGKLLRVLQDGEYVKLGTNNPINTDVRLITATNADLESLIKKGEFRKDFYYRLKGAWLHLPPLRKRKQDIPLLISHFLKEFSLEKKHFRVDEQAMQLLGIYEYPGNIRELKSIIQSAVNLAEKQVITINSLPDELKKLSLKTNTIKSDQDNLISSLMPLREIERDHILKVYKTLGNNKAKTARVLKIGLNTLRRKLDSYKS